MAIIRVIISGRVQGVGYRAWTVATACSLGLKGWVRNLRDGNVEAVFSGEAEALEAMLAACREGPPAARVHGLQQFEWEEEIEEVGFISKPTV